MASSATKSGSEECVAAVAPPPQTMLESRECCHVARILPPWISLFSGLGLKKWVMTCLSLSLNRVASGVKRTRRSLRCRDTSPQGWLGWGTAGRCSSGCRWRDPRGTPCSPRAPQACGHGWWCDRVGVGQLRQRDRARHGERSGARDEQGVTPGLILQFMGVLHTILLSRLVRGLWGGCVQRLQLSPSAAHPL